jgi:hypothetical protein
MKKMEMPFGGIKEMLSREQMKQITGGYGGSCSVRCDQNTSETKSVENCNRDTVEKACGSDLSNAVCVCS